MKTNWLGIVVAALMVLPIIHSPTALAQGKSGKALVIGTAESPTVKALGKNRERIDGKRIAEAARTAAKGKDEHQKRADAVKRAKKSLQGVSVVLADLKATKKADKENDRLLMRAARESGIPIVLENVTTDNMTDLFSFGIDADMIVIESRDQGSANRMTAYGGPAPKIEEGKTETFTTKRTKDDIPTGKKEPTAEELKAWQVTDKVKPPGKSRFDSQPDMSQEAERIIGEKSFSKGGKKQTLITNSCPPGNTACREWEVWRSSVNWYPYGYGPMHFLRPAFSFGQYKLASGESMILFRFQGDIGTNMAWNGSGNRGYFMDMYRLYLNAYSMPPGWRLDRMRPDNSNSTANLASTTGWSVGVSIGADATGPNAAVSGGYSETETFSQDITDFTVTRTRPSASAVIWDYKMTKSAGAAYNVWTDLINYGFGSATVYGVPRIASNGTDMVAEASFAGPKGTSNCSTRVNVNTDARSYVRRTWVVDTFWTLNYYTNSTNAGHGENLSFCTNWPG